MKCRKCNCTVTRKSKFCLNCGSPIIQGSSEKRKPKQNMPTGYGIALFISGILVGFGLSKIELGNQGGITISGFQETRVIQSAAVIEIAKEFNCPCGKCDHRLDSCTCDHPNGALEIKNFIANQLRQSHKKRHIMEMVQDKYGGLKNDSKVVFQNE
ncbi:hypothetical protein IH824_20050 [candidate division KSB1 bacterium]|nr:hypothetical protein [candidate division KSB1 bacterium]